jgi:hypothetical protein
MTIFMPESYAPVLLARKTTKLIKETGRTELKSHLSIDMSTQQMLAKSMIRPIKMLTTSPIVFLMCMYVAMIYGILYLFITTIPTVFQETYGWKASIAGLAYLGRK